MRLRARSCINLNSYHVCTVYKNTVLYITHCTRRVEAQLSRDYEGLHKLAPCSLRKWQTRCVIEDWPSWTESARRRYSFAPQYVRDLLGLPRLGRNFDKYYPPAVVQKTQAYVRKRQNEEEPSEAIEGSAAPGLRPNSHIFGRKRPVFRVQPLVSRNSTD